MTADEHSLLEMLAGSTEGSTDGALGGAREKQSFSEWVRVRGRIAMTGYSRNAIVHQGRLDLGDLIQKPLASAQLATTIRNVLDA